ncbi:hypothetical protein NBRC10513_004016 [Rhodotorula toruloides]
MKQPKFDVGKLLELYSSSTEEEVGQKVVREFKEPEVLAASHAQPTCHARWLRPVDSADSLDLGHQLNRSVLACLIAES